jgi:hypothetical protein
LTVIALVTPSDTGNKIVSTLFTLRTFILGLFIQYILWRLPFDACV